MKIEDINRLRELSGMALLEDNDELAPEIDDEIMMSTDPIELLNGPNYDIVRKALNKAEFSGYKTDKDSGVIEVIISPQDYEVDKKNVIIRDLEGVYNPITSDFFKDANTQQDIQHVTDNKNITMTDSTVDVDNNNNIVVKINYEE